MSSLRSQARRSIGLLIRASLLLGVVAVLPAESQTVLRGTVIDQERGQPISSAQLQLAGADSVSHGIAVSDEEGLFQLEVPHSGTYTLSVTRIGYASIEGEKLVLDNIVEALDVEVRLGQSVVALDPIVVVADRGPTWGRLDRVLVRAQRNQGLGRGRIYLKDDLEQIWFNNVQILVDQYFVGDRCRPAVFVNGLRGPVSTVTLDQLEAIELYRESHDIPAEHYRSGMCGAVLLWTESQAGEVPWSWKRLAAAGGIVSAIVFLFR